jgi:hypothetical protein
MSGPGEVEFREEDPAAGFCDHYESPDDSTLSQFSFQLRGPPVVTNCT